jgi:uncharacterized protein (DUF952 family)
MEPIFHVTRADDWRAAQARGAYRISTRDRSLEEEGFIHCSYAHQLAHVVSTYFRDVEGLLVLVIDPQRVNAEIRQESAGGDERFPHIYGPLNLDAVIETRPVPVDVESREAR